MDTSQYRMTNGHYVCQPCELVGRPPLNVGSLTLHELLALATRHDAERHAVDVRFPLLVVESQ